MTFDVDFAYDGFTKEEIERNIKELKISCVPINIGPHKINIAPVRFISCQEAIGKDYLTVLKELFVEFSDNTDVENTIKNIFSIYDEKVEYEYLSNIIDLAMFDIISDYTNVKAGQYPVANSYKEAIIRINR